MKSSRSDALSNSSRDAGLSRAGFSNRDRATIAYKIWLKALTGAVSYKSMIEVLGGILKKSYLPFKGE